MNPLRLGIQIVLAIVIAVGAWLLYQTITDPWEEHEAREFEAEQVHTRMGHLRTALIDYRDSNDAYPSTLSIRSCST